MFASTQASTLMPPNSGRIKVAATALPTAQEAEHHFDGYPNALSAYRVCLQFERNAIENARAKLPANRPIQIREINQDEDVIRARVLGYLLLFAPSRTALEEAVKVIHSCDIQGDQYKNLHKLGEAFVIWFIRPFRKFKGKTPATSEHPSRPSFDKNRKALLAKLEEAPKDHRDAKELALYRDGYRCIVTGKYDARLEDDLSHIVVPDLDAVGVVHTECAHIVPESTLFGIGKDNKAQYAASVLNVLKRFGYEVDKLNGPGIHSLFNVMTLQRDVHDFFDRLEVWFEKTDIPNQYRPKSSSPNFHLPEVVTFTSRDPRRLPLPSSELLALHAACSKVARLSGAAEYLDKFDRDMDDLGVLASDGTSSAVLHHAIWGKLGNSIDVGA